MVADTRPDALDRAKTLGAARVVDVLGRVTRMSGKVVVVGYHQGEPRRIPWGEWSWMAYVVMDRPPTAG